MMILLYHAGFFQAAKNTQSTTSYRSVTIILSSTRTDLNISNIPNENTTEERVLAGFLFITLYNILR